MFGFHPLGAVEHAAHSVHPIAMAQHLERQGMHPIDAMIHSLAHHIASQGHANMNGMSNNQAPRGRGPINNRGGYIQQQISGFFH